MLPFEEFFSSAAVFIHSDLNFLFSTVALVLALSFWKGGWRRLKIFIAISILSLVLSVGLKAAIAEARPCAASPGGSVACPSDFALPSIHTTLAFSLVAASIGTAAFPVYFIYGIFVAASRLYLGVHSASDICAGLALALFCAVALQSWGGIGEVFPHGGKSLGHGGLHGKAKDERGRKAFQAALGIFVLALAYVAGTAGTALIVAFCLSIGLVLFHMKSLGARIGVVDTMLERLERPSAPPGFGALAFFCGMLIALAFIPDRALALSSVYLLAVSDGAASVFGAGSKLKLPYHRGKSFAGSLAFFAFSLPVYFIGGVPALAAAALATLIESLPTGIDDNLTIPWAGVAIYALRLV